MQIKMQYIMAFLTASVLTGRLWSQTPSSTILFEERIHNFGTIEEKNGKVTHTFVFQNNDTSPIVIDDIHSSCGCIGNVLSKDPVKPGGKGKVMITFNPEYKSGFFSKEILVYSNDRRNYSRIWVEGKVKPAEHPVEEDYPYSFGNGLYLRLKVMAFGYLKPGETRQMQLHYANATDKEMTLNFIAEGNKTGLKFTNPGTIGPRKRGVINVSYTMPSAGNNILFRLFPYVNNKKLAEPLEVKILNEGKL
jgi:hypothetical protein